MTDSLRERVPLCCGFILSAENSNGSVETIRSSELNWKDGVEVYFGSKLHQNVVEFLTRGARLVEFTENLDVRVFWLRTTTFLMSQLWKRWPEMEENPKDAASEHKKDTLFTGNKSIVANRGNIDSHGSTYCNLEESS